MCSGHTFVTPNTQIRYSPSCDIPTASRISYFIWEAFFVSWSELKFELKYFSDFFLNNLSLNVSY